uniref:Gliding motility-associated C-terminal domain-containing protein n=1 Tax=Rhabditophanes sp. KR3021 TaxID=114890 RepID=A0AC35TZ66_9BILA
MGDQVVSITTGVGSLTLDCQDLIFNNYNDAQNSLYTVSDPRIKIVASTEIKVLVQVIIGNGNGKTIGDIYMVYPTDLVAYTRPTNFVGKQYTVKLPKATDGTPALISLMAFDNGLPITGYIAKYVDGNEVSRETFNLQTALGSDQAIYADGSSNRDVSYRIFANADFVVVAAVPCVDLSFASGNAPSGSTSSCDYAALTPLPILNYDCRSVIDRPIGGDLKGISTAFTNIIFELPFAVACSKNLLVSNYITDEGRLYDKVSVAMGKSIRLDPKKTDVFACESDFTQIKVVQDQRLKITSNFPIKVLIQVIIGNGNGQTIGDMYLAYPVKLIGNQYTVKLPKAVDGTPTLISFSALDYGQAITASITKYVNGKQISVDYFNLNPTIGSNQAIYVGDSSNQEISYNILSSGAFVVTASVPCVDTNYISGQGLFQRTDGCDYAAFTPLAIQNYDCSSLLNGNGDIKGISSDTTTIIYELPNTVVCNENLLVHNYKSDGTTSYDRVSVKMGKSISQTFDTTA